MNGLNQMDTTDSDEDVQFIQLLAAIDDSTTSSSSSEDEIHHPKVNDFAATMDEFNDMEFRSHVRLRRSTADFLIQRYQNDVYSGDKNAGRPTMPAKISIYMYLWYISNTVTYRQLSVLFGVTKSTSWMVIRRVVAWLVSISHEYITWPTGAALQQTCSKFEEKKGIPGVVGAIYCTHIAINAPNTNKDSYFNRKNTYSLVLQAIVDADKKFIDVYCGEPGSMHDSRVLRRSRFYRDVTANQTNLLPNDTFIIGDSAYKCTNWLITPFKDCGQLRDHQRQFNYIHSSTRMVVENTFGALKGRFRRLLKFTEHRDLCAVTNLIVSACVLHNLCIIKEGDDDDDFPVEPTEHLQPEEFVPQQQQQSTRREILLNYLIDHNII